VRRIISLKTKKTTSKAHWIVGRLLRASKVRGKLDMKDPNKSLRDPVYYRSNPVAHHRIGSKYEIYPTYDFACPFVDAIEGITHALRSSEHHDRNAQYHRIQEDLGVRKVYLYEFSRLNMVYTVLSKRKLPWFVENGKVDGWDDARFPTVQGIIRRGLKVEALVQLILEQAISSIDTTFIANMKTSEK
jgi:glutamyl-tRNA synthetase